MGPKLNKWLFRKVFLLSHYHNKVTAKGTQEEGAACPGERWRAPDSRRIAEHTEPLVFGRRGLITRL